MLASSIFLFLVVILTEANVGVQYPSLIQLESLDNKTGLQIWGAGGSHSNAFGDFNHDGYTDLLLGSPPTGAYVIFGSATGFQTPLNVNTLSKELVVYLSGNFSIPQTETSRSLAAGDLNGDGIADIVIGNPNENGSYDGSAYIIYGNNELGLNGTIYLAALDNDSGMVIQGNDMSFGTAMDIGDLNGDGHLELIIAEPYWNQHSGRVHVYFGPFPSVRNWTFEGEQGSSTGSSVSVGGDVNADGYQDLVIGSKYAVYVVFGGPTNLLPLGPNYLNGSNGFRITDFLTSDYKYTVGRLGDFNSDGVDDLVVGLPQYTSSDGTQTGRGYVIYGHQGIGTTGLFYLTSLTSDIGLLISSPYRCQLGAAVTGGDVNDDGIADLLIGGTHANGLSGHVYVIFGSKSSPQEIIVTSLNGKNGFILEGSNTRPLPDMCGSTLTTGKFSSDQRLNILIGGGYHDSTYTSPIYLIYISQFASFYNTTTESNPRDLNQILLYVLIIGVPVFCIIMIIFIYFWVNGKYVPKCCDSREDINLGRWATLSEKKRNSSSFELTE